MRKLLFYLLIFVLSLISVNAIEEDLIFTKGTVIDLKIPCIYNNTYCSLSSVCNITINYPDGSNMVSNALMSNNYIYHNYTLPNTNTVGSYYSTMVCIDGSYKGYDVFNFEITNETNSDNVLGIIIGIGIVMFILLYFANNLGDNHFILKLLCIIFVFILLVIIPRAIMYGNETIITFYTITIWILRLFFTYVFLYFIYEILVYKKIIPDFINKQK